MVDDRVCVTNIVRDLRSCVVRGKHRGNCDGWSWKYDRHTGQTVLDYRMVFNEDSRENERIMVECAGCLPRRAEIGFLCGAHVEKLDHALEWREGRRVLVDLVTHVWSIQSGGSRDDNDRVASAFGSQWPLSESHLTANAIYQEAAATAVAFATDLRIPEPVWHPAASLLDGFATTASVGAVAFAMGRLVDWLESVSTSAITRPHSAEAVVRLVGVTQTALAKFPIVEEEHQVPYVRCAKCARMSLTWRPPLMNDDAVEIKCERCGHVEDQDWLDGYIEAVKTDGRRRS